MKRLFWILAMCLLMIGNGAVLSTVQAATPTTQAQKQKEKEKAQREKEKAKAAKEREKAKAQKEKEKAKAQKEKEKAQAQKEKDKAKAEEQRAKEQEQREKDQAKAQEQKAKDQEKAQAQKEKEQEQKAKEQEKAQAQKEKDQAKAESQKSKAESQKQASKPQSSSHSKPKPSEEETYQRKVAEVQKYNEKVAAYMSRDIAHRIGLWGQVGYSALFPSGFSYKPELEYGFQSSAKGGVGGGVGLGYQLRYKRFLFTTGLEMDFYTSANRVYGQSEDNSVLIRTFGMEPYADKMTYQYRFTDMRDHITTGFIQIPVLAGMEFWQNRMYFLAGAKVGLNVMGSSVLDGKLTTEISDVEISDPLIDMYNHSLVTDQPFESPKVSSKLGFNLGVSAEIGVNLENLIPKKEEKTRGKKQEDKFGDHLRYRIGLFAEYGVLNVLKPSALGQNDMPAVFLNNADPLALNYTSSLMTKAAESAKLNPFLVGVKLAVFYELPRKQLKPMRMPSEPTPRMVTKILNEETNKGLAGAQVTITTAAGKSTARTTNSSGLVVARYPRGEYDVKAEKTGFFASNTVHHTHKRDLGDTLFITLRPEPKPIVYTLCGYAYAGDTRRAIPAAVRIGDAEDKRDLYEGEAADDGLFVTELLDGQYVAHLRYPGYMPYDDTIQFSKDTLRFYLTKIKEGIRVKINNLFFATNKTYILPASAQAMEDLAAFLNDNEGVTIRITGHTDNVGTDEFNQKLSEGRANSVKKELIRRGVDPDRIETEGKGESEPVATNDTEEGRQLNRRVEFTITSTNGADIQQIR